VGILQLGTRPLWRALVRVQSVQESNGKI
jgi:hypothetical protein